MFSLVIGKIQEPLTEIRKLGGKKKKDLEEGESVEVTEFEGPEGRCRCRGMVYT